MAPRRRRGAANDTGDDARSDTDAHKNRPPNTAFRQQRMRAWQCVLTPKLIVTIFSVLAAIYLGFGAYLTYLAYTVRDIQVDYTDCLHDAPTEAFNVMPERYITAHFSAQNDRLNPYRALWMKENRTVEVGRRDYNATRQYCLVRINIPEDLNPTISFFYYLENFYQNHRRYVNSFNARQLLGEAVDGRTINESTCDPVAYDPRGSGKIVYPCGLVANSMFNDTFSDPMPVDDSTDVAVRERAYPMSNRGIAWPGTKDLYGTTSYSYDQIVPPPNWRERYLNNYTERNPPPELDKDEAFQNWMMLAATPNFYKLAQKNDRDVLRAGEYQIEIQSNFDTTKYNGRKAFVITTISTMGARNIWPGIIFLVVGGICLILDVYFILSFFLWKPRKLGDPSYLSWNQPSAAQGHASTS
ncbi:Cell division control protein 50 [Madurella mycetomatis]|uniref:Cell division control protein 50 n=1 Tax=Madurella mycetomatis TaxID=100816 RepID=A0A175W741_9PEZI|nr:Cell division control protein 50 [Madurella mycetomatis]